MAQGSKLKWVGGGVVVALVLARIGTTVVGEFRAAACHLTPAAAHGRSFAPTCMACHDISAKPVLLPRGGPNLQFVFGSPVGSRPLPGDRRNPALAAAGVVWTEDNLVDYLKGPKDFLVRTTGKTFPDSAYMPFFIGPERDRRDVAAYLKVIGTRPQCD